MITLSQIKLSPEPPSESEFSYTATFQDGTPLSVGLISFDDVALTFTVYTRDSQWIGTHHITITAIGTTGLFINQILFTTFSLTVSKGTENKPYLSEELKAQSIMIGESWEYKLPDALHKDGLAVEFKIDLSSCDDFVLFDD